MDTSRIDAILNYAGDHQTRGVVIVHGGRVVAERYWKDWDADTAGVISSATKCVVSILVGMCIEDGAIKHLDQSAADFFPSWADKPKASITVRHLLTMTSGLYNPPLWMARPELIKNDLEFGLNLQLVHKPGAAWEYHTIAYRLLFPIIERATGVPLAVYTSERLFAPLGMTHSYWRSRERNGTRTFLNLVCSTADMARFGQLVLQYGQWEGRALVSQAYVEQALRVSQPLNPVYGLLFWLNSPLRRLLPDCPSDTAVAMGAQDARIFVVPSLDLVVARLGQRASPPRHGARHLHHGGNRFHNTFLSRICAAVASRERDTVQCNDYTGARQTASPAT